VPRFSPRETVGVVPSAGFGQRLYPYPLAKELFPIGYQTIEVNGRLEKRPKVVSQYLIENMALAGIRRVFVVLGPGKHEIMAYYGNGQAYGIQMAYLFQDQPRGMPYAIDLITPWLRGDETVVLGMPDTLIEPRDSFLALLQAHHDWQADLTLGLFSARNPARFGMIGLDPDYNVIEHIDKPAHTSLEWLWGIACWGPAFSALLHEQLAKGGSVPNQEVVLGSCFDAALAQHLRVKGLPFQDGSYLDIGTYDDIGKALERYR
jgi:glucose-1-phosphate thymidylyltransferase